MSDSTHPQSAPRSRSPFWFRPTMAILAHTARRVIGLDAVMEISEWAWKDSNGSAWVSLLSQSVDHRHICRTHSEKVDWLPPHPTPTGSVESKRSFGIQALVTQARAYRAMDANFGSQCRTHLLSRNEPRRHQECVPHVS